MAFLGQTFDANELPQGNGGNFEPLPEGNYNATVTQAELKPTNDGTGQYIKLRLVMGKPGLIVNRECKLLRKALAGGYHFKRKGWH